MPRLTSPQALQIRHYYHRGWTVGELADALGCSRDTISRCVHRHTHKRLIEPPGYKVPPLPKAPALTPESASPPTPRRDRRPLAQQAQEIIANSEKERRLRLGLRP